MPSPEIVVRGRSDFSRIDRALTKTSSGLNKFARRTAAVAATALVGLAAAGAKFAKQAAEDEQAATGLAGALRRNADATGAQIAQTERYITKQGQLLGVTDDELRPALGALVTATHDVGEAQKDASLAMDVAAARGKSLQTVAEALMKAENGQTTGLARLGVKIKNAAGETLSFEKIQKRLTAQFGGAAAEKADTLSGKYNRLKVILSEAGESIGAKLIPPLTKLAEKAIAALPAIEEFGQTKIVPKLQDLAHWLSENRDEFADMAGTVKDTALPVLETAADVVGGLVKVAAGLPGPVQSFALQAGLAALVLPRLTGVVTSSTTAVGGYITKVRDAETRTRALGAAARNAAGIGGMVLLAQGATTSNDAISTLLTTAGGVATGFAVGGPLGGAVGGLGALLAKVATQTDEATDSFLDGVAPAGDYASALDQVSGAATKSAAHLAALQLQESGVLETGRELGLRTRDLVGAVLGREGATKRVTAALQKELYTERLGLDAFGNITLSKGRMSEAAYKLAAALGIQTQAFAEDQRKTQQLAIASGDLGRALQGVKDRSKIVARIEDNGTYPKTARQVAALVRGLDAVKSRKQITAVIKATGADATAKQVQRIIDRLKEAQAVKGDLRNFGPGLRKSLSQADAEMSRGAIALRRNLEQPIERAKPSMQTYLAALRTGTKQGKSVADAGARGIGSSLRSGLLAGLGDLGDALAAELSADVRQGIEAARAEADAHSPSRKTFKLGADIGEGLIGGARSKRPGVRQAGDDLMRDLLRAVTRGSPGISNALDLVTSQIEKRIKLKDDKKERAREKEILKALKSQYAALKKNGKAQEKNNALLVTAKDNLQALKDASAQYANTVASSLQQYASVTNLDAAFNPESLAAALRKRLEKLKLFAKTLQDLMAKGLNQTMIDQLAQAGVEGGLAVAIAIASGSPEALAEFNALQAEINQVATSVGQSTADNMYAGGIQAAQGIVDGLESQAAALDAQAKRLARKLRKALAAELKSKPLKVDLQIQSISLPNTFSKSTPSALAPAAPPAPPQPVLVKVKLTAQQVSQVQRGKELIIDINVARRAGAPRILP